MMSADNCSSCEGFWGDIQDASAEIEELEGKLATERAKRCEGCSKFDAGYCLSIVRIDEQNNLHTYFCPPPDFACNRWEAKEEQ